MNPTTTAAIDRTYSRLRRFTGVLTLGIAMFAFVVSFEAIREYAIDAGVGEALAWIIPLLVDTFIIVASLAIWLRSMDGERGWMAMGLLITATAVSLAINIAHAPPRFSAQAVAAIPPAALIASFHVAMSELRRAAKRRLAQEAEQRAAKAAEDQARAEQDAARAWFEALEPRERARVIWEHRELQGGERLTGQQLHELLNQELSERRCFQLLSQFRRERDREQQPTDRDTADQPAADQPAAEASTAAAPPEHNGARDLEPV